MLSLQNRLVLQLQKIRILPFATEPNSEYYAFHYYDSLSCNDCGYRSTEMC